MRYTVYKVLEKKNGKLISAGRIPNQIKCQYKLKKKNYGKLPKSKIFVFRSLKDADSFKTEIKRQGKSLSIFKGKCRTINKVKHLPNVWDYTYDSDFDDFIKQDIVSFWKSHGSVFFQKTNVILGRTVENVYSAGYIYLEEEVA